MINWALLTETGGRKINEDSIMACEKNNALMFALADGLGGHGKGEVASALAVGMAKAVFSASEASTEECLAKAVMRGQHALMDKQASTEAKNSLKTTLVLLQIKDGRAQWAHVGDSRLYHFTNGNLPLRTLDHSVPQMLVAQGEITDSEIRHHEDRNRLTRAMGNEWDSPKYTLSEKIPLKEGDVFLLCSDGFWELITEDEMCQLLKESATPKKWLDDMEQVVLRNGWGKNMDNYSAIAVFI